MLGLRRQRPPEQRREVWHDPYRLDRSDADVELYAATAWSQLRPALGLRWVAGQELGPAPSWGLMACRLSLAS